MNAVIRRIWGLSLAVGLLVAAQDATAAVKTIGGYGAGYRDGGNDVSQFRSPRGVAVDLSGRVVVADYGNNAIRLVVPATETVTTFARNDGFLSNPIAVAVNSAGDLYVVNNGNGTVTLYRGNGSPPTNIVTNLAAPTAIALDRTDTSGTFFVTDGSNVIRVSGDGTQTPYAVGVELGGSQLNGIVAPGNGSVFVSDSINHVLWRVPLAVSDGLPSIFAGSRAPGFADGLGTSASFNQPMQLAQTTNGIIVVADQKNHRVRAVNNVGAVTTLFGVPPSQWTGLFPGWADGDISEVESHDPVGVAVANNGTVFDSELHYHLIRMATGLTFPVNPPPTTPPPGSGGGGGGSTNLPVTGNRMTLGFANGQGSVDLIASPGQNYTLPIALAIEPNTSIYGMQFTFTMENTLNTNVPTPTQFSFVSGLRKPNTEEVNTYHRIDPKMFMRSALIYVTQTNLIGNDVVVSIEPRHVGVFRDLVFTNATGNMLAVGWFEAKPMTNLYPTTSQDLITFSSAHNYIFNKSGGKVLVGSISFQVPLAAVDNQYELRIGRPSANGDSAELDVPIAAPNDPQGPTSAIRRLRIGQKAYIVGDVLPLRWFNAGEFGDGTILNNDLDQVHLPIGYGYNYPPPGSDFFDAMDSCCVTFDELGRQDRSDPGFEAKFRLEPDTTINSLGYGDGVINLADFYVSFRRSLDPSLSNVVRFWQGGQRKALPTNNTFRGTIGDGATQIATKKKSSGYNVARAEEPVSARFTAKSIYGQPGQIATIPVQLDITGPITASSLHFRVHVSGSEGFSALSLPVAFAPAPSLGNPWKSYATTNTYEGVWFELAGGYPAGSYQIGTISVPVPADATADTLFNITFETAEASVGITMFPTTSKDGIIIMPNRAAAPWTDEIPDAWRMQYFGSIMNILSAPDADADGDGYTTLEEYRAGTNPNDVASVLAVSGKAGPAAIVLNWPTIIGKSYKLESSPSLTSPTWTVVEQGIAGTGASVQRSRTLDSNERFFRVSAQ